MSVKIFAVEPKSPADKKGIRAGDELIAIDGNEISDVLDYSFFATEKDPTLLIKRAGKEKRIKLRKNENQDLGLEFETYLMDRHRPCKNKCVFCFVDQLPKGMRKSLYFKDDDSRLSFLFGNYITLTNMTEAEAERIVKMHISPINVSVHTMNPELRSTIMGNPDAGDSLKYLGYFAEAGIDINTQLVLCPGLNDGKELDYSLKSLGELGVSLKSIAAVPVGLTKHRQRLFELSPFTKKEAADVIDKIADFNRTLEGEQKVAYAADEFYLLAGREIPEADFYGDYPQLENGVGLWALFKDEFLKALESDLYLNFEPETGRQLSVVTGMAAYPLISNLVDETLKKWHNLKVKTYPIVNDFFGSNVNVSGLLTGSDIIRQLPEDGLGQELLIPMSCLRHADNVLLDDVSLEELSEKLGVKVRSVEICGDEFLASLLGMRL